MNLDIMVDLETYGVGTRAAIAQIAAVPFSRIGKDEVEYETFTSFVSLLSNQTYGLQSDPETLNWWSKQPEEVYHRVIMAGNSSKHTLQESLIAFSHYLSYLRDTHKFSALRIWGNGSVFDNRILMSAFEATGVKLPWKYNEDRDLRTLIDIGEHLGLNPKKLKFEGIQHDAIDDCKHQIRQAQLVFGFFEPEAGNLVPW